MPLQQQPQQAPDQAGRRPQERAIEDAPWLVYEETLKAVVCTHEGCERVVHLDRLTKHLQDHDHGGGDDGTTALMAHDIGRVVTEAYKTWPDALTSLHTDGPLGSKTIGRAIEAVQTLPVVTDGFACRIEVERPGDTPAICRYIATRKNLMVAHLKKDHKISTTDETVDDMRPMPYKTPVYYHRVWRNVPQPWYIEITRGGPTAIAERKSAEERRRRETAAREGRYGGIIDGWMAVTEEAMRQTESAQEGVLAGHSATDANAWLDRSGWSYYFHGRQRAQLAKLMQRPDDVTEAKLGEIWRATADLVGTCDLKARANGVSHTLMDAVTIGSRWLVEYQTEHSVQKAKLHWCRIVQLVCRSFAARERAAKSGGVSTWPGPDIPDVTDGKSRRGRHPVADVLRRARERQGLRERQRRDDGGGDGDARGAGGAERFTDGAAGADLRLRAAVMRLSMQLLRQEIKASDFDTALTCALCYLGIGTGRAAGSGAAAGEFLRPGDYTSILSSVIHTSRLLALGEALGWADVPGAHVVRGWQPVTPKRRPASSAAPDSGYASERRRGHHDDDDDDDDDNGKPRETALERVRRTARETLAPDSGNGFAWALQLRQYGMKIARETTGPGLITYVRCEGRIYFKDTQFLLEDLKGTVHAALAGARRLLLSEVLLLGPDGTPPPDIEIPWGHLHDTRGSRRQVGLNFATRQDSPLRRRLEELGCGEHGWLGGRIRADPALAAKFIRETSPGRHATVVAGARDWLGRADEFLRAMLFLLHATGGQPARATELLCLRVGNTEAGGEASVTVEEGEVVFTTRYHKGYWAGRGRQKVIKRFLPRPVGELLVWWVWLGVPWRDRLLARMASERPDGDLRPQPEVQHHLWQDLRLGAPARRTDDATAAEQPQRTWTRDHLSRALHQATEAHLGRAIGISDWRHIMIFVGREFLGRAFDLDSGDIQDEPGGPEHDHVLDLQAGHSTRTAQMKYGRTSAQGAGLQADKERAFRRASRALARWWGLDGDVKDGGDDDPGDPDDSEDGGDVEANAYRELHRRQRSRREALVGRSRDPHLGRHVRDFLARREPPHWRHAQGEEAEKEGQRAADAGRGFGFREGQEAMLRSVLAGESPVLHVAATGAGKSLAFMLPAWLSDGGVTVVVAPLVSLVDDLKERCRAHGLRCFAWQGGGAYRPPDDVRVVVTTPEAAGTGAFREWALEQRRLRRLDRVAVDECHTVIDPDGSDWRPATRRLQHLTGLGAQLILTTATLPPCQEDDLRSGLGLPGANEAGFKPWVEHRSSARRANIRYEVLRRAHVDGLEAAAEECRGLVDGVRRQGGGRCIVYARSKDETERVARALGVAHYHADVAAETRARLLRDLRRSGGLDCLVATTALGMGVDVPDVRLVLHLGPPFTAVDFVQESGRAGRDGHPARSVVLMGPLYAGRATDDTMADYLREDGPDGCLRATLEGHLDGTGSGARDSPCGVKDRPCGVCRPCTAKRKPGEIGSGSDAPDRSPKKKTRHELPRSAEHPEDGRWTSRGSSPEPSGDGGGEARATPAARQTIQRQDRERAAQTAAQRGMQSAASVEFSKLAGYLRMWARRCPLCNTDEHPNGGKMGVYTCGARDEGGRLLRGNTHDFSAWRRVTRSQLPNGVACFTCIAPAGLCARNAKAFREAGKDLEPDEKEAAENGVGRQCTFADVVLDSVGLLLIELVWGKTGPVADAYRERREAELAKPSGRRTGTQAPEAAQPGSREETWHLRDAAYLKLQAPRPGGRSLLQVHRELVILTDAWLEAKRRTDDVEGFDADQV